MRTRVNWFQIIADLKRCGVSSYDIEHRLDVSQSTVLRWGQGSEPRYHDGQMLIEIWCEETGREPCSVPKIRMYAAI